MFGGAVGADAKEAKHTRKDRAEARRQARLQVAAVLTDAQKIAILGQAIVTAIAARGAVTIEDCRLSGITKADSERLHDDAMAYARTLDAAALAGATP